jgi:hypothetical protein
MKKNMILLLLCSAIGFTAYSQSSFLDKGQNGFGINGGFSSNEDLTGFFGSVGYSFSGIFDLGLSVGRFGFKEQLLGEDFKATEISPNASFFVIKQDEKIPVSFSLNASYHSIKYSNKLLSDYGIGVTGNAFSLGASLYSKFEASDAMRVQPSIGFAYITGSVKTENQNGLSDTEDIDTTLFALGLSLIFQTSPNNSFVVTPSLSFGDDVTTFGITLSLIIPQFKSQS